MGKKKYNDLLRILPDLTNVYDTLKFSNGRSYKKMKTIIDIKVLLDIVSFLILNSGPF